VRQLIEKIGCEVLYLRLFTDLNRSKSMVKLKQLLRCAKARTSQALEEAIAEAIRLITPDNAKAWFDHCFNGLQ